jgi:hypothetical protein
VCRWKDIRREELFCDCLSHCPVLCHIHISKLKCFLLGSLLASNTGCFISTHTYLLPVCLKVSTDRHLSNHRQNRYSLKSAVAMSQPQPPQEPAPAAIQPLQQPSATKDRRKYSRLGCNTCMAEHSHQNHLPGGEDVPLPRRASKSHSKRLPGHHLSNAQLLRSRRSMAQAWSDLQSQLAATGPTRRMGNRRSVHRSSGCDQDALC